MASEAAGLAPVDWAIMGAYVLGVIGLGYYYSRRQRSTEEYFTGSGHMNPILIGFSLFATLLSTISYLSMPGEAAGKGLSGEGGRSLAVLAIYGKPGCLITWETNRHTSIALIRSLRI